MSSYFIVVRARHDKTDVIAEGEIVRKCSRWLSIVLIACCFGLATGSVRAENVTAFVSGGFTTFSGDVTGSNPVYMFINPPNACSGCPPPIGQQICPDAGCDAFFGHATNFPLDSNGLGHRLFFQVPGNPTNQLSFQPAETENIDPDSEFKLGTLTFENGLWTGNAVFGFTISAHVPFHGDFTFTGNVDMGLTPNTGNADQNADYIYLANAANERLINPNTHQPLPSLRVFELGGGHNNVAAVDLYGQLGSLDPTGFANLTGDGFLDISATNDLGGPPPGTNPVPEPGTLVLLSSGLLAMTKLVKRRSSN